MSKDDGRLTPDGVTALPGEARAPAGLGPDGRVSTIAGYACAEHLSRRAEYELTGTVIYARPCGTYTTPVYIGALAAAAPELLEALEKLRKGLDLVDPNRPLQYANAMDLMRKCADAAIARATGAA